MNPNYLHMDPFLLSEEAEVMLGIAESFGSFGTYAEEATSDGLGESLPQRFDVGLNYVAHGLDGGGNDEITQTMQRTLLTGEHCTRLRVHLHSRQTLVSSST